MPAKDLPLKISEAPPPYGKETDFQVVFLETTTFDSLAL